MVTVEKCNNSFLSYANDFIYGKTIVIDSIKLKVKKTV